MRLLQRLGDDIARRHFDELALVAGEGIFHQHPDGDAHAFELHVLFLGLGHEKSAQLGFRRTRAGAKFHAAIAEEIQRRDALGHPRRMVDVRRRLHDAMTDTDVPGALADRGQKNLRCRRVGVLFKEMMLGGPHVIVSALIGKHGLFERVLEQRVLGIAHPRPRELMFVKTAKFHGGK